MGDRSSGTFTLALCDKNQALEVVIDRDPSWMDEDLKAKTVQLSFDEVSGGGYNIAEDLEEAEIPFRWWWGAGCAYDAGEAVFMPGEGRGRAECSSDGPVVHINRDGTFVKEEIEEAVEWYRISDLFNEYVERMGRKKHKKKHRKKHRKKHGKAGAGG